MAFAELMEVFITQLAHGTRSLMLTLGVLREEVYTGSNTAIFKLKRCLLRHNEVQIL